MQEGKQPLRARLQLLARLTLNAGEDAANQPARLAQLDDGYDRATLVQGDEGPAQIVRLGHRGTPSIDVSDEIAILAARPIASLCSACERHPYRLNIRGSASQPADPRPRRRRAHFLCRNRRSATRPRRTSARGDLIRSAAFYRNRLCASRRAPRA